MPYIPEDVPAFARKVERLTYTKAETCLALGVSPVTLWRLEKRGLLMPVPHLRHKMYSVAAVRRFVDGK